MLWHQNENLPPQTEYLSHPLPPHSLPPLHNPSLLAYHAPLPSTQKQHTRELGHAYIWIFNSKNSTYISLYKYIFDFWIPKTAYTWACTNLYLTFGYQKQHIQELAHTYIWPLDSKNSKNRCLDTHICHNYTGEDVGFRFYYRTCLTNMSSVSWHWTD